MKRTLSMSVAGLVNLCICNGIRRNICILQMLFTIPSVALFSQTAEYKTTNFTDKLSPLKVSITALSLDNIKPQVGLLVQGAKGKLGYEVFYRQDIAKKLFTPKDNVVNPENLKSMKYLEGGIDYFFVDKLKKDESDVRIEAGFTTTVYRYFDAVCDKRKQFGIHAGLLHYNQTAGASNASDGTYEFVTTSGAAPSAGQIYFFRSNSNALVAGLVFKKIRKASVSYNGYKNFRHFSRRIFLDALIGGTSYESIQAANGVYTVKTKQPSPIGYRIGFEWDQMGVVTRFEIGQRPKRFALGLPGYNYFNLSFSFNVFHGDKTYAMSSKYDNK